MSNHHVSPVHVHVADVTPVFVHVKKSEKKHFASSDSLLSTENIANNTSLIKQRPVRYKPPGGPWVPPPGKTTRGIQQPTYQDNIEDLEMERMLSTINKCQDKMNTMVKEMEQLKNKNDEYAKELNSKKMKLEAIENEKLLDDFKDSTESGNTSLLQKLIDLDIESNSITKILDNMLNQNLDNVKNPIEICNQRKELNKKLASFRTNNCLLRHLLRNEYKKMTEVKKPEVNFEMERNNFLSKISDLQNRLNNSEHIYRDKEKYIQTVELASLQAKEKSDLEKESLKKNIKQLKSQMSKNESNVATSAQEASLCQKKLNEVSRELEQSEKMYKRLSEEKCECLETINKLQIRLKELELLFEKNEMSSSHDAQKLKCEIHEKIRQNQLLSAENINLKTSLNLAEDKLTFTQKEMTQIQSILKDYENHLKHWEKVRCSIESIDHLPAQLRVTELKLSETSSQVDQLNKQHLDDISNIQKMKCEIENLKKCLQEQQQTNNQFTSIGPSTLQVEALSRDNYSLQQQFAESLKEGQKLLEHEQERLCMKDRAMETQMDSMQTQLNKCMQELAVVKREKDDLERKNKCKFIDLKDRLEKSHQTNSALQNYVQFMKNSYSNVFGSGAPTSFKPPTNSTPFIKMPSMYCDSIF